MAYATIRIEDRRIEILDSTGKIGEIDWEKGWTGPRENRCWALITTYTLLIELKNYYLLANSTTRIIELIDKWLDRVAELYMKNCLTGSEP